MRGFPETVAGNPRFFGWFQGGAPGPSGFDTSGGLS